MVTSTATKGKIFFNGEEIGEVTDFTYTVNDGKSVVWDIPKMPSSWSGTLQLVWRNKIDRALGFTHYAKNGKLFRK